MSIRDYIDSLDIDQVRFSKRIIDERLREFDESENVSLYIVSGVNINVGCYRVDEFSKAKEHLVKLLLSEDFHEGELRDIPTIRKITVKEEEVEGWMEINGGIDKH